MDIPEEERNELIDEIKRWLSKVRWEDLYWDFYKYDLEEILCDFFGIDWYELYK